MNNGVLTWIAVNGTFMGMLYLATFNGVEFLSVIMSVFIVIMALITSLAYYGITSIETREQYLKVMVVKEQYHQRKGKIESVPKSIDFLYDITVVGIMIAFGWYIITLLYIMFCVYQKAFIKELNKDIEEPV